MHSNFFNEFNEILFKTLNGVDNNDLAKIAEKIKETSAKGNKIILVGNGGSAAMASHVAVDLTKTVKCRH
jgi:D-sedoheptulose 7-phosphate isomerase